MVDIRRNSRRRNCCPRIAHGQRYPMPCLEWLVEEVEWEQGSGPKGPMSCRTQGWISIHPEKAYLRPLGQFSMIFNGSLAFFSISHQFFHVIQWELHIYFHFFINFPCYSMGILHFFSFSCQWEICILYFFWKFSMLFNGEFAFCQFSMLFNGNLRIEKLQGRGGTDGRTDGRPDGCMEIHPCVLQDIGPLGLLPKNEIECYRNEIEWNA